jgi:uncharacterized protein (TIGR03067 family)
MKPHCFLLLGASLLLAADQPSQDTPRPPRGVQGTWSVVSMEYQGKKVANEVFANTRLIIAAGKIATVRGGKVVKQARYKLHPNDLPRGIDLIPLKGSKEGQPNWGIYALESDTLRICARDSNAKQGTTRPQEFVAKPDSDLILMVLKREKS